MQKYFVSLTFSFVSITTYHLDPAQDIIIDSLNRGRSLWTLMSTPLDEFLSQINKAIESEVFFRSCLIFSDIGTRRRFFPG
jgi:hypothetical protein